MIAISVLQNIIAEIATITGVSAAVYSADGKELAIKGDLSDIVHETVSEFVKTGTIGNNKEDVYLNRINKGIDNDYISIVKNDSSNAFMASRLISVQLESLVEASQTMADKDNFIKNLLLDNLLQIDLYNRSRKLNIEFDEPRVVFVIKNNSNKALPLHDVLAKFISSFPRDFLSGTDEYNQIIVHSIKDPDSYEKELDTFARQILNFLNKSSIDEAEIAYGSKVDDLKGVSNSYKEANFAYNVGSIFYENSNIISYNKLGIGRLIYQLPINLCHLYIDDTFSKTDFDEIDEETLHTVEKFFQNSLNVSESARKLFIHRNTLVYRLDKIKKRTGLDLRIFDDAIKFKIAVMVIKYMNYLENTDF